MQFACQGQPILRLRKPLWCDSRMKYIILTQTFKITCFVWQHTPSHNCSLHISGRVCKKRDCELKRNFSLKSLHQHFHVCNIYSNIISIMVYCCKRMLKLISIQPQLNDQYIILRIHTNLGWINRKCLYTRFCVWKLYKCLLRIHIPKLARLAK
jgi:hypothetical protein